MKALLHVNELWKVYAIHYITVHCTCSKVTKLHHELKAYNTKISKAPSAHYINILAPATKHMFIWHYQEMRWSWKAQNGSL